MRNKQNFENGFEIAYFGPKKWCIYQDGKKLITVVTERCARSWAWALNPSVKYKDYKAVKECVLNQSEARKKFLEERIKHNKFTNDMAWRERGEEIIRDEKELKELIKIPTRFKTECLDWFHEQRVK